MDAIAYTGFIIGVLNYEENVDQSTLQDEINKAVNKINSHLEEQDSKINRILELLEVKQ